MSVPATLVIENISELVTGNPQLPQPGVIRDASVAVVGDRVVYAGPMGELDVATDSATVGIDGRGAAVIPGFIDCHTHICWLGDRSEEYGLRAQGMTYEEIARRGGGIRSTVRATAVGTREELQCATAERARQMLALGSTTIEVKTGYGMSNEAELRQLDVIGSLQSDTTLPDIVPTWLPLHAVPDGDRAQYLAEVEREGLPIAAQGARFVDCFCDEGAWSVEECGPFLRHAVESGLTPKLHAEQRSRSGGAQLAAHLGAASADHLDHASDDDMRALGATGVTGVILPGASLVLGGPPPPGRRLLDAGVTVAIATDCNPGTCYSESMPLMLSLAVATAGLTPAQALQAGTVGGAAALRLRDRGRLMPGQRADMIILDSPHWLDVAYHLGANPGARVIRAGHVT